MKSKRFLIPLMAMALAIPGVSWGFDDDEMVFDVDDVEFEFVDDDDDSMTFAPDDFTDPTAGDSQQVLDVGVVVVPGDGLTETQRVELQRLLLEAVRNVPNITAYGDGDILPALIDRDPEYCSREALCLAGVGRAAGVQRIVQARIERVDGRYRFDLDYFDVQDRLFVAYYSRSNLNTVNAIQEFIQPGVNDVFNIRERRRRDDGIVDADVDLPRVLAYTSGGLSVVALGMGTFFGLRANQNQAELEEFQRDGEGRFSNLSQREAQQRIRDLEANALSANLSLGIGSALAVTSIALFVISSRGGDDAAPQASADSWYRQVELAPRIDKDGVGFGARWNF